MGTVFAVAIVAVVFLAIGYVLGVAQNNHL